MNLQNMGNQDWCKKKSAIQGQETVMSTSIAAERAKYENDGGSTCQAWERSNIINYSTLDVRTNYLSLAPIKFYSNSQTI